MSRCLTRVAEILGLAESKKITDRRNFIKDLQEAYQSEEYVEAINDETSKDFKGSVSWNQIMLAIHHVLVTETDKVVSKTTKGNTAAILQGGCCDLMKKTVNLAISTRRMSLSCGDFMAMIFQIFGKIAYESYYDTYIGILSSVLANRTYRSAINWEQWREVLKLVQTIYFQSRSDVKGDVLETARLAVQYGCSQSYLTLDVKKMLPFLEKVYREVASDRETQKKPVYKLTYAVCQQIGTESRIALCEFSEKILPAVITVEGCPEKYKMMLLLIRIHHPGGAVTSDDGAYARDWEQWKNIMRGIYASIARDTKPDKMPPRFLELACEVYRLVMMDHSYVPNATPTSADLDDMQPRKRRRLSVAVRKPVDMLLDNDLEVTWVSVQVLTILLRKYPDTLKIDEYEVFLKTVTELVTASLNNEKIMDSLCELCTVLVNAEKEHWHDAEKAEAVRTCWEKIWETILRALSMNQNEKFGHALLQSTIEKRGAVNPHGILRLYLTNAIRWSRSSVMSLLTFCDYTPVPDELVCGGAASSSKPEGSTRISLLQWSLDMPSFKQPSQVPFPELANLLTALVVRSWYEHDFRDFRKFQELEHHRKMQSQASMRNDLFDDREEKYFNDIERCSLSLDFRQNDSELVDEESRRTIATKPRIFHVQEALTHLIGALNTLFSDRTSVDELETNVAKLTIVAKVLSNFGELNIRSEPQTSKLVNLFGQHFKKVCSFLVTNQNTLKFDHLVRVIEALEILYTTRYNREVTQIVSTLSSMDFLKFIFDLSEDHGDSDDEDDENSSSFNNVHGNHSRKISDKSFNVSNEPSRGYRLRQSAYKILTYFCCTSIDDKMLDAQTRVLRNLMKISLYENTSNADLRCALEVLKTYGTSDQLLESGEESLEIANNFIRQLLQSRLKEETAVRGILNVLPHFLEASTRFIRETEKILEILLTIKKRLAKKYYGPLVLRDFVKCIADIVRSNPSLTWGAVSSVEPPPIIDVLVYYIDNPFYLVRVEVVRALHHVFASKDLQVPTKANFFSKIESAIRKLFSIEEISDDLEKMDEHQTRTLTAVQIYAAILRANKYLSSRALYSMITLSVRRDVKIKTIERALLYVTKTEEDQRRLIELNLHDLLSRWFEDNYPLQLFPWTLVHCDSQEDFSRRYIDTLLSIKLQRCEFHQLATLCNNLEVSFPQTVEDSFPTIMTQLVSTIVQDALDDGPEKIAYAKEMYARLRQNAGEFKAVKSFDVLLMDKLSDVLVHLVQRLHDDEHFFKTFSRRVFLPAMNPPNLTVVMVDRCLGFLEEVLPVEGKRLVEYLSTRCPSTLQRVYETLFCNVNGIDCRDRKLQAFHQYRYFGTLISRELAKSYLDSLSLYIVRDTSYSLLSLTKDETLAKMACDYLYEFLRDSMPDRSCEIKEVLSFVVSTLVPLAQSSTDRGAMKILEFLIIEQKEWLGDSIKKLGSFPSVESFEAIQHVHRSLKYDGTKSYSLEDEMEHFLNATDVKTLSCSHEGLVHVKNQLATRKEELRDMYDRLEGLRGFAEDCASSTLHKLIYKLVQLTRSSDTNISLEAAKCLGELGPADLTTMILHAENVYAKEDDDKVAMLTFRVTSQLIDYLVDNNTNLRRACSSALYEIFATPWGNDFAKNSAPRDDRTTHRYIYPFINQAKSSRMSRVIRIDHGNWQSCIDPTSDLWTPAARKTHDRWITDLTCKLLDCFVTLYTPCLKPVCRESVEFCEMLLPRLVDLVRSVDPQCVNDVCLCINRFFLRVYEALGEADISMTISESPMKNSDASLSHECVRSMINVVNFMRIQTSDNAPLCLDYLYIAKAAQYCSAYFTSVLYAELWCQYLLQDSRLLQDKVPGSWISAIDCICESEPEAGKLLQSIVREAYLHIGDPDSIYGCGFAHLIDSSYRIQHYIHLRQWDKMMLTQDVEMCSGNGSTRGILYALQQSGLQGLMGRVISTINREQENVDDFTYEAAWRLADWNIIEPRRSDDDSDPSTCPIGRNVSDYHSSHYRALKCLRDADFLALKAHLDDARTSLIGSLHKISLECSQTVYPILSQLRMLREIEDFACIESDDSGDSLAKWRRDNSVACHDFQWVEPILSQRLVVYRTAERSSTNRALVETHLEMAEIAAEQGYLPIAARALDAMSRLDLSSSSRDELTYHEAFLAWKRNDQDIGRYLMRNLIKKSSLAPNLRAKALSVYGNWMAITKSENPQAIIEKYYEESIKTSVSIANKSLRDAKNITGAQADLAQFADAQYQQIVEFMQSPQYESLRECAERTSNRSDTSIADRGRDERRAMEIYQRQMTNDANELKNLQKEKDMYLILAARYYLMTLQSGDEHDLLLFRLVSLWLDNTCSKDLDKILAEQLQYVASYKFIVLLPQLAPHMSNGDDVFGKKIHDLMKRCAQDHPHHTLPVLLALKNTHKDDDFKPPERGTQQRRTEAGYVEPRVLAADALISKLMASPIRTIIREMSDLSHALVALAYFKVTEAQGRKKNAAHVIPRTQPITKIRNYANACVPTLTVPVRPGRNYNDVVGVREYVANFDLPGGANAPKKIVCVGTDGIRRTQLVKGQDDLRQDAVMQQVCTVMNDMLRTSKETKKRKLHIRTYKIVPLSRRSGILEWCENTLPISHVLCDIGGKKGMHTKYYPDDWSVATCRAKLYAVDRSPFPIKREVFLECCRNLHPAFHHFFMEKYPSAETWFERRLAYVRSVATTSMVGHMLGLGDRHFSNILIDQTTAEVIHIDFGIAFAQGKVLPIPETVPFRLTRDMEVAMGICGVEGVMRRSCEETVAVLRDRRKILITLLQVLLYDPLFSWSLTRDETDAVENDGARRCSGRFADDRGIKKTNKVAERALLKIEQKLQGTEDGISSSISGQVERLIQQARDPSNLCRLYSGWQAYL